MLKWLHKEKKPILFWFIHIGKVFSGNVSLGKTWVWNLKYIRRKDLWILDLCFCCSKLQFLWEQCHFYLISRGYTILLFIYSNADLLLSFMTFFQIEHNNLNFYFTNLHLYENSISKFIM